MNECVVKTKQKKKQDYKKTIKALYAGSHLQKYKTQDNIRQNKLICKFACFAKHSAKREWC